MKSGTCRRAILKDGKIVGWEEFRPPKTPKMSPEEWAKSPQGKKEMMRRILSEQRLGEGDFKYWGDFPLLEPVWRGGRYQWGFIPTE